MKCYKRAHIIHKYSDSQEEVHRVAFLLDEVLTILHELFQRHHGVVVDIEFVVSWPRLHGNQHNAGIKLLLENLWNQDWFNGSNNNNPWPDIKPSAYQRSAAKTFLYSYSIFLWWVRTEIQKNTMEI